MFGVPDGPPGEQESVLEYVFGAGGLSGLPSEPMKCPGVGVDWGWKRPPLPRPETFPPSQLLFHLHYHRTVGGLPGVALPVGEASALLVFRSEMRRHTSLLANIERVTNPTHSSSRSLASDLTVSRRFLFFSLQLGLQSDDFIA